MDEDKKPDPPPEPKSCDSCGWIIKTATEVYSDVNGEITCEHCLELMSQVKELH